MTGQPSEKYYFTIGAVQESHHQTDKSTSVRSLRLASMERLGNLTVQHSSSIDKEKLFEVQTVPWTFLDL
jgi:hypothetical protein